MTALVQPLGQTTQESPPAAGREVADRAAQEAHQPCRLRLGEQAEVALEVADESVDAQPGVLLRRAAPALSRSAASETSTGT